MSKHFHLRKGINLPIHGVPMQQIDSYLDVDQVGHVFNNYPSMAIRMLVKEGEAVKLGQPIATDVDKKRMITSFASGIIEHIYRGDRRKLLSVVVKNDKQDTPYKRYDPSKMNALEENALRDILLETGLWNSLRSRPYDDIPSATGESPKAVFITAMDCNPLGRTNLLQYIKEHIPVIQLGIQVFSRLLPNTPIHINTTLKIASLLQRLEKQQISVNTFEGPYPAGLPGTHMHYIAPLKMGETAWHIDIDELIYWGQFFKEGILPTTQLLAIGGGGIQRPRHFLVHRGMSISVLLKSMLKSTGDWKIINGSVFWGTQIEEENTAYVSRTQTQISVIADGKNDTRFLGWLFMYRDLFSAYFNVQLSKVFGTKAVNFSTNMYGGPRAMICLGQFEAINPLQLLPSALLRSVLVGDVTRSVDLGLYELVEEDVAHFSFIDIGKNDYCGALRWCLKKMKGEDVD